MDTAVIAKRFQIEYISHPIVNIFFPDQSRKKLNPAVIFTSVFELRAPSELKSEKCHNNEA